jgi:hypothetical protein
MADGITLYDVLGVSAGAAEDTIRYAYEARIRQLRSDLATGAPSPVVSAVSRAREAVEMSWLVLSDAERRHQYDEAIGLHRQKGLRGSSGFAEGAFAYGADPRALNDMANAVEAGAVGRDVLPALAALLIWLAPQHTTQRRRQVPVPDLNGMFYRPCQAVVNMAGLRLAVVRLTPEPLPVEGLIVGQSPAPGTAVKRQSTVTVQVWHPPRPMAG